MDETTTLICFLTAIIFIVFVYLMGKISGYNERVEQEKKKEEMEIAKKISALNERGKAGGILG